MIEKIKKGLNGALKKFGYDDCEVEDYGDDYYYVRYIQLDDRLTDEFTLKDLNKIVKDKLKCESVSFDRVDAFPNGFAAYSGGIQF